MKNPGEVTASEAPAFVHQVASRLGTRLRTARRRRRLTQVDLARKAGVSRRTLIRVEAGDLGTGLGAYLAVLWALRLETGLDGVADPDEDHEGLTLEMARLGQRVRPRRVMSDDF